MAWKLLATLAIAAAPPLAAQPGRRPERRAAAPAVDSLLLRSATWCLANDLLQGRATGRRGNDYRVGTAAAAARRRPGGERYLKSPGGTE